MIDLIDARLVDALATSLIHSLWQGALVVALIVGGIRGGLIRTVDQKCAAHLIGTLMVFVAMAGTFLIMYSQPGPVQEVAMPLLQADQVTAGSTVATGVQTSPTWQYSVALGWVLGAFLYLIRMTTGWAGARAMTRRARAAGMHWQRRVEQLGVRLGINARVRIRVSEETAVPFVFGALRPVIVFPAIYFVQLTPAQLESILLHELAHIRRHDFLINLIQLIIESLMFFNPAIWWMGRQLRTHREFACDDKVRGQITDQRVYLEALYQVAALKVNQPACAVSLFHHNSELIMRVKRMLNPSPQTTQVRPVATTAFGLVALIGLFLLFSGSGMTAQKPVTPPVPEIDMDLITDDLILDMMPDLNAMMLDLEPIMEIAPVVDELAMEIMTDLEPLMDLTAEMSHDIVADVEPIVLEMLPVIMESVQVEPLVIDLNERVADLVGAMDLSAWSGWGVHTDSIPNESEKVKALRKQIEAKQQEIEELSARFEAEMSAGIEVDAARMEELAEQLTKLHEQHIAKVEEQLENSGAMQRIEELSAQLEQRMEAMSEGLEEMLDEELIRDLEQQMEARAREYESMDTIPREMREQMRSEMRKIRDQMQEAMAEYRTRHAEMRSDPEIQRLRQELREAQRAMRPLHDATREMWTDEAVAMREQLEEMQKKMREQMSGIGQELREQMRAKSQELRELHQQLRDELRKQHQEKGDR
ncbi:MAG: M56 family metallopeptidase [Saprospiraceae bacterium]|nr:M56 family metallopeptidase [Saprospiraceae bacterium]